MNFHSDTWIMGKIKEHYNEALRYFPVDRTVGIFNQGSGNYGLDIPNSDVDTKLIVTPSFDDIIFNRKPVSTTHILPNNEHLDAKDIRLYFKCFKKQNLNFLEILFTPYKIINPFYAHEWERLEEAREAIARMNPYRAVQSMKGVALEKFHAMEHRYPSKVEIIDTHGYDNKQLHHLLRVEDYLERYIRGEKYEDCLRPSDPDALLWEKTHFRPLEEARSMAIAAKENIERMAAEFYETHESAEDPEVVALLDDVQSNIMRITIRKEL